MSERHRREELENIWRRKLQAAEDAYARALARTQAVKSDLPSMAPSDGNFALSQALEFQTRAINEYTRVLQAFTRLILYGEEPVEPAPSSPAEALPPADLDIQEWVVKRHGFVPHPAWIAHCKELYLGAPPAPRAQDCPPDKRIAIREALVSLGLISE